MKYLNIVHRRPTHCHTQTAEQVHGTCTVNKTTCLSTITTGKFKDLLMLVIPYLSAGAIATEEKKIIYIYTSDLFTAILIINVSMRIRYINIILARHRVCIVIARILASKCLLRLFLQRSGFSKLNKSVFCLAVACAGCQPGFNIKTPVYQT